MVGALSACRILDLSSVGPAARAAGILADYGAHVVKVLRPVERAAGTFEAADNAYGGARRVTRLRLDLTDAEGHAVFLGLVDHADVVLTSYRPGVAERLGIDAASLRARNQRLVYCALTGYGSTGPYSQWAGHDLNYVGLAGMLRHGDDRADGPSVPGATIGDAAGGGMHAVIAVLVSLLARERSGCGATLDVSASDGALWLMSLILEQQLAGALETGPMRLLTGAFGCYTTYPARDAKWLSVAALEPRFWRNLCSALGLDDLVDLQLDAARQDEVKQRLTSVFATRDRDDWVALLGPADTCVAPVNRPSDVVTEPQFVARGLVSEAGLAPLLAGTRDHESVPAAVQRPLSVHDILREAGFDSEAASRLRRRGVLA